ncbi:hypothetical protein ES703_85319 [subsurface metagenome]
MIVKIKQFDVAMEIKNNGIEIDVSDTTEKHLGDLFVTKTRLIWCKGRTRQKSGKKLSWPKFIEMMAKVN